MSSKVITKNDLKSAIEEIYPNYVSAYDVYDEDVDDKILDKYIADNQTEKGIKLVRRLYAFYLVK